MTPWPLPTWTSKFAGAGSSPVVKFLACIVFNLHMFHTSDGACANDGGFQGCMSLFLEVCEDALLTVGGGECRLNAAYMAVHTAPLLGRHLWLKTSDHGQAPIS